MTPCMQGTHRLMRESSRRSESAMPGRSGRVNCNICCSEDGRYHLAKEKYFGIGASFVYFECSSCGCLQLVDQPADVRAFYPDDYYSFEKLPPPVPLPEGLRRWMFARRNEAQLLGRSGVWRWIARWRPRPDFESFVSLFANTSIRSLRARILGVGCGNGRLLRALAAAGFENLVGVDAYLPKDVEFGSRLRILATSISH